MDKTLFASLGAGLGELSAVHAVGRVAGIEGNTVWVTGLVRAAAIGDRVRLYARHGRNSEGEVIRIQNDRVAVMLDTGLEGVSVRDRVALLGPAHLRPSKAWIGRVIDPYGRALDDKPLIGGSAPVDLRQQPPSAVTRRRMGDRLRSGLNILDTVLPIVRGQRIGLFAGSGVGKSRLLAHLARHMQADVVVVALVGERGRELREFVESALGPDGMARSVVVTATSDRSPLERRRCLWSAMAVAEHFRATGQHVLLLVDSVTRFAEAHREVALASGEIPALRGFPPSVVHEINALCERAGPGAGSDGDITAVFSVLVAGSDMEEPIADILRGVLDGHVVLDRQIAERGRYPAINVLKSVSRSLPDAASPSENALIVTLRSLIGAHEGAEAMIRAGLYRKGSDPLVDQALNIWPAVEDFLKSGNAASPDGAFQRLALLLRRAGAQVPHTPTREGAA
ncbi:FliI/YscN family ATPase [Mesobacterium sp. TK19101]|uniref:FliI/YscN family ATPase n=1 Tax=Mesobacterium hydrothermale TaxID=3111907 RepID=A0ABU6HHQ1_9RHOB|nr:FliI/YscN family ATPase [Mesobacterium sp. TK19101]MEC3861627.1 FliI/YscN family ATPase [Mesobacterium sp. TK19101]